MPCIPTLSIDNGLSGDDMGWLDNSKVTNESLSQVHEVYLKPNGWVWGRFNWARGQILRECDLQLLSIGACSFNVTKKALSAVQDTWIKFMNNGSHIWNASSRHAIQHWHTMKHVMPSIPTISHLTQHPGLVSISQSVHICPHNF